MHMAGVRFVGETKATLKVSDGQGGVATYEFTASITLEQAATETTGGQ